MKQDSKHGFILLFLLSYGFYTHGGILCWVFTISLPQKERIYKTRILGKKEREKLKNALKGISLRNIFKNFFIKKEKKKTFLTIFYISYESGIKTFIKLSINKSLRTFINMIYKEMNTTSN